MTAPTPRCKWCAEKLAPIIHPQTKQRTGLLACLHCDVPHQMHGCNVCKRQGLESK